MAEEKKIAKRFSVTYRVTIQVDIEKRLENLDEVLDLNPTCEVEMEGEIFEQYEPLQTINREINSIFNSNFDMARDADALINFIKSYIERELGKELCRASESLFQESFFQGTKEERRDDFIRGLNYKNESAIRKRLKAKKGKPSLRDADDFHIQQEEFLNRCFAAIEGLFAQRKKRNKAELARAILGDVKYPTVAIDNECTRHGTSFKDIVKLFNQRGGQKIY